MTETSKKQRIFHRHLEWCLCNENLYCPTIQPSPCSVIECHGVPSALGECSWLWYREPPSHPAQRIRAYWLCTSSCNCQSRARGKLSTLLIHFGHLQFKSLIQHFPLCFTIPLCALPAVQLLPRSSSGVLLSAASDTQLTAALSFSFSAPRCFSSIGHF